MIIGIGRYGKKLIDRTLPQIKPWTSRNRPKLVKEGGPQIVAQLRRPEQPPNSASNSTKKSLFRSRIRSDFGEMKKTWLRYQILLPSNSASTYSIETKVESSRCDNNSLSKRLTSKCWWVYLKRMCSLVLVLYAVVQETASNCHCDYCLQDKFAVTSSGGSGCCQCIVS